MTHSVAELLSIILSWCSQSWECWPTWNIWRSNADTFLEYKKTVDDIFFIIDLPSISSTFFVRFFRQYFGAKKLQSQTFQLCNFWHQNIGKKSSWKMLMKLTPGIDFINVQWAAFMCTDSESAKKTVKFFALSGFALAKAACRSFMKLTPRN